jgi:2-oxoglutarate ferredoxin oxidoreductase subunit gamma
VVAVPETKLRFIGAGGHGILTMGSILGTAAVVHDGKEAVMVIGYSPAQRGGWSRADVIVSDEPIDFPIFSSPDVLVSTTQETYELERGRVRRGGVVVYEAELVEAKRLPGVRQYGVYAFRKALELGLRQAANMVLLGFINAMLRLVSDEAIEETIKSRIKRKYLDVNLRAYEEGRRLWEEGSYELLEPE